MNRPSKITNLLAAAALSLGIVSGVSAQSESLPVSVSLEKEEALCAINFEVSGGFGAWVWNGTEYVYDPASSDGWPRSEVFFYGEIVSQPTRGCDITVEFGGLSNGNGGTIGTDHFSVRSVWQEYLGMDPDADPAGWTHTGVTGEVFDDLLLYDFDLTLNSVPSDLEAGEYTGEVDITYSNAE